jgi:hypothetical protein
MEVNVISALVAKQVNESLTEIGKAPSNKIVILTLDGEKKLPSGLIVPEGDIEGIAKRGVLVQSGTITEEYLEYRDILITGVIIYYGDYAGKELENVKERVTGVKLPDKYKLIVLCIN